MNTKTMEHKIWLNYFKHALYKLWKVTLAVAVLFKPLVKQTDLTPTTTHQTITLLVKTVLLNNLNKNMVFRNKVCNYLIYNNK